MTLALYGISGSPYTWRVQLALEHKGVAFELRTLSMSAGDNRKPEFLALNPRGQVPVLVDVDYSVYESLAILAYIEARWPTPSLFGTAPRDTGKIWRTVAEYTCYLDEAVEQFTVPLYFNKNLETVEPAARTIAEELPRLTASLGHTRFLAGDEVSAADFVVLPALQSLLRAAGKPAARDITIPFLPLPPHVEEWRTRIEALPYYARTVPAHWR